MGPKGNHFNDYVPGQSLFSWSDPRAVERLTGELMVEVRTLTYSRLT
jgi:hypothetical protein